MPLRLSLLGVGRKTRSAIYMVTVSKSSPSHSSFCSFSSLLRCWVSPASHVGPSLQNHVLYGLSRVPVSVLFCAPFESGPLESRGFGLL